MKKTFLNVIAVLALTLIGTSAMAQNGNGNQNLIGKARGAANECLIPYLNQGIAIDATVETTGICFVSGSMHSVNFYTTNHCHQEPCPRPATILVATVYFDCDNNVVSVECAD